MSLVQFFRILWARKWIIALTTLVSLLAAVLVGKLIPPRYEASSRLQLDVLKPDPVSGEGVGIQGARAYFSSQQELIKDYRIAGKVVDDLGWANSPDLAAQFSAAGLEGQMDFRRWLAQRVIDNTTPKFVEGSPIMEITYTSNTPEAAATVADAVRKAYVDETLARKREDARRTGAFFRQQMGQISQRIAEAEKRKTDFERANGVFLGGDELDPETRKLDALATATQMGPNMVSGPIVAPADPVAAQLVQADAALAAAAKIYGPNHPDMIRMRQQRQAMEEAAAVSRPTIIQPQAVGGTSLASAYNAQQAKVLAQRGKIDEARKMAADIKVLREQYVKSASRAAELQQQSESEEAGVTLLGNAIAPASPVWPKWPLLIFGSFALGLALGTAVALLAEMLGMRVRGVEDLRIEGVSVLGSMGKANLNHDRRWWHRFRRQSAAEGELA